MLYIRCRGISIVLGEVVFESNGLGIGIAIRGFGLRYSPQLPYASDRSFSSKTDGNDDDRKGETTVEASLQISPRCLILED